MNVAVILAGGSGTRFGDIIPKQFLKVAGKRVIEHTIDRFEEHELIDEICIVSRPDCIPEVEQIVVSNEYKKVRKILAGGETRYYSSLSAINAYVADDDNLLFHDAVRPLVSSRIISDCIEALEKYNAVDVAIKTTDTIIQADGDCCIDDIPDREFLYNGQTPQCFKRGIIHKAYQLALKDPDLKITDDCGVVRKYLPHEPIYIVKGDPYNMKLTYVEDLFLLDKLFQLKSIENIQKSLTEEVKKAIGDSVIVVFGGNSGIGAEVVDIARTYDAKVFSFSRSQNSLDVSDIDGVTEVLNNVNKKEGRIDLVIDTAGLLIKEPIASMPDSVVRDSINTNLLGVINVAKASFPFLKRSNGSLLFYTSSSYTRGRMMYSVYSATKSAIVNFVQAIAEEWQPFNIRVNCINPERTKTPMRTKNFGSEPEGSLLDPKMVAIASLNTAFSSFTGEVVDVRLHSKR